MKKSFGFLLIILLLNGCIDKSIDVQQYTGCSRTIDYGEFVLELETSKANIVKKKFVKRLDLKGKVLGFNTFNNRVTIPSYSYIIRVSDDKNQYFYDIYVPKDFYDTWSVGDTIDLLKKYKLYSY